MSGQDTAAPREPAPMPGPRSSVPTRRVLFLVFFFAVYLFLLYELARILSPFFAPLLGAIMLVLIFFPLHAALERASGRPSLAAAVTTFVILLTIIVPVIVLVWLLVREAADVVPLVREWVATRREGALGSSIALPAPLDSIWQLAQRHLQRWEIDIRGIALEALRQTGNQLTSFGAATVRQLFGVLLDLVVLILALFFFLRDGLHIVRWILDLVPMEEADKQMIVERLDRTVSAMLRGAFITASAQGALTGVGLAVTGVPFPVLLGFASALLSVVPFVGASLVWVPAGLYLLFTGQIVAGVGLLLWGALVVGLVDNFLRPYVIGEHAQLPVLLLLVGVLGGLQVYGLIGALLSPLVIAAVLAFARLYREQYIGGGAAGR